jgi:hypothetical protein
MIDFAALAATTVSALQSPLKKMLDKGLEKSGESLAEGVLGLLERKLTRPAAREALQDLAEKPEQADRQAAFRVQLQKTLEGDPELAAELNKRLGTGEHVTQIQTATASGHGAITQIQGANNTVR